MKICGIIAEYNPLHLGHIKHIEAARRKSQCDYLISVLDGSFTQRGEAAVFDKFTRVRMALAAGVDAVFELPAAFALLPAEGFACGGIGILQRLGVDSVSFGCETEDVELLECLCELTENETEDIKNGIHIALSEGKSYPRAVGEVLSRNLKVDAELLKQPNLILAMEYRKAAHALNADFEWVPVLRREAYHDSVGLCSAGAVRRRIREGNAEEYLNSLPVQIAAIAREELWKGTASQNAFSDIALYTLRNLKNKFDDREGLIHAILKNAHEAESIDELIQRVKCKRYTYLRVSRLITRLVLQMEDVCAQTPYVRLLGVRRDAMPLLEELKRRSGGFAANAVDLKDDVLFRFECRATDLRGLLTSNAEYRKAGREYTERFVLYD